MYRLLNAGFARIKKDKVFIGIIIITSAIAIYMLYSNYMDMKKYNAVIETSTLLSNYLPMIGISMAIFTGLFVGVEYSDGTIRNKIIAGHTKTNIYLSNFIFSLVTGIIFQVVWTIIVLSVGIPIFGMPVIDLRTQWIIFISLIMIIASYATIFNFVSILSANKTISAVTCILLFFIMMGVILTAINILQTSEYIQEAKVDSETGEMSFETVPNIKYPSESKKKVCQTITDIIPTGQAFEIGAGLDTNVYILPLYSLAVTIIFNGIGIYVFNKKDLK